MSTIHYVITPGRPDAHVFTVSCTVPSPDPDGQVFSLPAWTPGSYLIRDFARHVLSVSAIAAGNAVAVRKTDKASWRCAPCTGPLTLRYEVYAWDDSVRGASLDATRGFFNGSAVFMRVSAVERMPVTVDIAPSPAHEEQCWRVATTLRRAGASLWGFGRYAASGYEDLIDHPVELGVFDLIEFEAGSVPHQMALSGRHRADAPRLASDLSALCAEHIALFGAPAPMSRYLFLTRIVKKGYGGLEHRDSSALICAREDLPLAGENRTSRNYRTFLGLCSHEYFHLWNAKRIRPVRLAESELDREAYTEDLWAYEGVTSYYDELALIRSGLIDLGAYCELIAEAATRLWRTPGRAQQSLAASSFDAWIKFYRPDENTPNAGVSYYNKGALVALCLDLKLRLESAGRCTLDQVMRELWRRHGQTDLPMPERGLEKLAEEISGCDLRAFFEAMIRSTDDPPLAELLPVFAIEAQLCQAPANGERANVNTGLRFVPGSSLAQIANVIDGSPAQAAGLSAGDVLIALDGLRVDSSDFERMLSAYAPGETVTLHAFRRDELVQLRMTLASRIADTWLVRPKADADEAALARRKAWLRQ